MQSKDMHKDMAEYVASKQNVYLHQNANGKLIVIDGGFSKAYHKTTGIAGYTLIYNSHGMRIKAHQPFESVEKVLEENKDIESTSKMFETEPHRLLVGDTDDGKKIKESYDQKFSVMNAIVEEGITDEEKEVFRKVVLKIRCNLGRDY